MVAPAARRDRTRPTGQPIPYTPSGLRRRHFEPSAVRRESAGAPRTESTASRVRSSESGHRCEYVSSVSTAEACPSRAWTVFTLSPVADQEGGVVMPQRVQSGPLGQPRRLRHRAPQVPERLSADRLPVEREHEPARAGRVGRQVGRQRVDHDPLGRHSVCSCRRPLRVSGRLERPSRQPFPTTPYPRTLSAEV